MKQIFNPYLPSYEYVPDGEPHVFGDRVYVYGSHDKFNGKGFCLNDYVCYSAPIDNLKDWKFEGVIWKKTDDPQKYHCLFKDMYAPDVVQGYDGRYYLYYFKGNNGTIDVAVCDTPAGRYKYHGRVKYPDGTILGRAKEKDFYQFDPGVFRDDDGSIYLYTGFAPKHPNIFSGFRPINTNGAMGCKLEKDMLTVQLPLVHIAKSQHSSQNTKYVGHEFFEASSMRKFNGKYYFIYSSVQGHELCYATSDSPLGQFEFGGTLVSIGDVGLSDKPMNYLGNTHGSVEKINGKYYVFYHRQTNGHCYSRQACAEEIEMTKDGNFVQAEVTSCGLNGAPLVAKGEYSTHVACHLYSKKGVRFYTIKLPKGCHPYFTQTGCDREENGDQHVANCCDGTTVGFKYFDFLDNKIIGITLLGKFNGQVEVKTHPDKKPIATIDVKPTKEETKFVAPLQIENGKHALYFHFVGKGSCKFLKISFDLSK